METKQCKYCKEEIAKKAKRCPKCGRKFGMPTFLKVIIVILLVIFGMIGCVAGCTSSFVNSVDEAIKESENEYVDVNGKTSFKVGETFENKKIKVTLNSINTDFKNYSSYADVKNGYKIIQATFSAENIGVEDQYFSSGDFNCYADGVAMEDFFYVDDSSFGDTLTKGKISLNKNVYFEVPKDAQKITIEYDASWLDDINIEFVVQ